MRNVTGSTLRLAAVLLPLLLVVAAGCGGDSGSPIAPSLPTGGGSGSTSGATVQGRVNGMSGAQLFNAAATISGEGDSGLTVEVLGTGQSAEVGPDGEFMITGLGALADVVLRVSGPDVAGGSQDVALGTSLGADGTLEVELSVDSGTVRVDSVEVDDDSPDDESADDTSDDDAADDESSDDDSADDDDSSDDVSDDDSADDASEDDDSESDDDESEDDDSSDDDESEDDQSDDESEDEDD